MQLQSLPLKSIAKKGDLLHFRLPFKAKDSFDFFSEVYGGEGAVLQDETTKEDEIEIPIFSSSSRQNFLDRSPIESHQVISLDDEHRRYVKLGIKHLQEMHNQDWQFLKQHLKGLIFVELRDSFKSAESQVTSISLPGLPYLSLFSKKSFFHAPPLILTDKPSIHIFSENLIHEATHQWVNLNLVDGNLLKESYISENSPSIRIPWRSSTSVPRDRIWPIDRCLHACLVYLIVARFRLRLLQSADHGHPYSQADLIQAIENGIYLAHEILEHSGALTLNGKNVVQSVNKAFKELQS
ncbi:hypothetical protein GW916_11950 [bacterium]|nr:hypothetical protein [bacterium]